MRRAPKPNPEARRQYYFFCAASTAARLRGEMQKFLEEEPLSTVHLLYYQDNDHDVQDRDYWLDLTEQYRDQFYLQFQLLDARSRPLPFSNKDYGSLTQHTITEFVQGFRKHSEPQLFLIYASEPLGSEIESFLQPLGIDGEYIYRAKIDSQSNASEQMSQCKARITLDGNIIDLEIKDQTILQSLIDAGYDPPYSCTSGVCTTCMAKLSKGKVEMEVNYGLDEGEVAQGFILTCQSRPTTEEIEVSYDI